MFSHLSVAVQELSLGDLEDDPHLPIDESDGEETKRLMLSILAVGILQPISVMPIMSDDVAKYRIVDGHRRVRCAYALGLPSVLCRIYEPRHGRELGELRFALQHNSGQWSPLRRAASLAQFRASPGIDSKHAAEAIGISKTQMSNALKLHRVRSDHKALRVRYGLGLSYQVEFAKLYGKLRPIRDFTIDDIVTTLCERVSYGVITSSKDFRTVGRIFMSATRNLDPLYAFLSDPDMSVNDLRDSAIQPGLSLWLTRAIEVARKRESDGVAFTPQERLLLFEFGKFLKEHLQ